MKTITKLIKQQNMEEILIYKKQIKKYINSLLKIKNTDKKLSKLLEVFQIYNEVFEQVSEDLTSIIYSEDNEYSILFLFFAERLFNLCDQVLEINDVNKLCSLSDYQLDKMKISKKSNKKTDSFSNKYYLLNYYFDIKDKLDVYLLDLKNIIDNNKDEKKILFAKKEYFSVSFQIYTIIDDLINFYDEVNDVDKKFIRNIIDDLYLKIRELKKDNLIIKKVLKFK